MWLFKKYIKNRRKHSREFLSDNNNGKILPFDILTIVFYYLSIKEVRNIFLVCKFWNEFGKNEIFCKKVLACGPDVLKSYQNYRHEKHMLPLWLRKCMPFSMHAVNDKYEILKVTREGQLGRLKFLIANGVKVNDGYTVKGTYNQVSMMYSNVTPLLVAAEKKGNIYYEIVKFLLENGAHYDCKMTSYTLTGTYGQYPNIQGSKRPINIATDNRIRSLLWLAGAEQEIKMPDNSKLEIFLLRASLCDAMTFNNYVNSVIQTGKGLAISFSEEQKEFIVQIDCVKKAAESLQSQPLKLRHMS